MKTWRIKDHAAAEFPKVASVSDTSSTSMPTIPMKTPEPLALGGKLYMPYIPVVVCETLAAPRTLCSSVCFG